MYWSSATCSGGFSGTKTSPARSQATCSSMHSSSCRRGAHPVASPQAAAASWMHAVAAVSSSAKVRRRSPASNANRSGWAPAAAADEIEDET